MKSYKAYSNSAYLKKEDFPAPEVLTISGAREEEIKAPNKEPKRNPVLYFEGIEKGLVLNQANGDTLFEMTGYDDPEQWIGTCVEAYCDPSVKYAGKKVGGIRLRQAKPAEENGEAPF
jgi:hypothetical protein